MLQVQKLYRNLMLACSVLLLGPVVFGQKVSIAQMRQPISDSELKAFTKAYVEYQQIRKQYEPSLTEAKDDSERKKIQNEANEKLKKALAKQNLTPESYNRIFRTVNGNESLRKKALKLIEQERESL